MALYESGLGPPDAQELRLRNEATAQIQAVVQQMVGDPKAVAILSRAGLFGDFTADEELYLVGCSGAKERFPNWRRVLTAEHLFSSDNDRWTVAKALARRIVSGVFVSTASDEARAYVFERTFATGKPENCLPNHPTYYARQRDFKISFDEFYAVLKEFATWDQLPIVLADARKKRDQAPDGMSYDEFGELLAPLHFHEQKIFRKHGLINYWMTVRAVETSSRVDGFSINDRAAVLASARNMNLSFIKDLHA